MCARPISSSRALLRVCTREQTHRVLTILWAIDRYSSTKVGKKNWGSLS